MIILTALSFPKGIELITLTFKISFAGPMIAVGEGAGLKKGMSGEGVDPNIVVEAGVGLKKGVFKEGVDAIIAVGEGEVM
jgi:hypothetical protein